MHLYTATRTSPTRTPPPHTHILTYTPILSLCLSVALSLYSYPQHMEAKQHAADLGTVKDAAHVNQLFGGSFSDGVGSNTWASTPFQKYDYKDGARMESLSQVSAAENHAQIVKCLNLAKTFKGIKKGHFKVTEAEKIQASQVCEPRKSNPLPS